MFYYEFISDKIKRENLKNYKTIYYFNAGEVFEPNLNIYEIYKKVKLGKIDDFLGEYNYFFEDSENIYVFSDELGAIKWFYYFDGKSFVVSNDFWKIAKNMDLGKEDLDLEAIYEFILYYFPLNNKTFFKRIRVLPQGSLLIFSKKNKSLIIKKIKRITYKTQNQDKEVLFKNIDQAFYKTINKIKQFNKNLFLGITISGGLDSRFPLFYTKNLKKIAYLIGVKKYVKPLDLISSEKLAQMFNIKLKLVHPFKKHSLEEKLLIDIARNPIGPSNFLKAINKKKSFERSEQFTVLITGAYGGLVGGRILNDELINSNKEELVKRMFYFYSSYIHIKNIKKGKANFNYLKKAWNKLLIHLELKEKPFTNYNKFIDEFLKNSFLIPKDIRYKIFKNFKNYFEDDFDNLSKIMSFHLYRHSIRGAFESLHGQVKAYSIYYPYIYELSKHWPVEYLKGRKLMEEFIVWKDEKSSNIPLQSFDLPLTVKQKKNYSKIKRNLLKLSTFFSFSIRGLVINYNKWWHFKYVQKFINKILEEEVDLFNEIFNPLDVEKAFSYKRYNLILENLIKIKMILKIIEHKDYDKLINLDILESEKF